MSENERQWQLGDKVMIVNAPGRKTMQECEMPALLYAHGEVIGSLYRADLHETLVRVRFAAGAVYHQECEYTFHADEVTALTPPADTSEE